MRLRALHITVVVLVAPGVWAQPKIDQVLNNYSFIFPGMPNYGIAQGSIFDVFGSGLATETSPLQNVPLPTALNGVSVQVTVNGVTTTAILYFVSPTQIAAILPSATPVGTGQITVTVNGQTSDPGALTVVESAFGMLALNGAGDGPAAALDVNGQLIGLTNAANPGDYISLWGSGLGPVTGDETMPQTPGDLTGIAIDVEIGGVPAAVAYHGRSQYPGLDQINVVVPAALFGCHVPVVVRTGDIVSNFGTIPVAANGRVCAESVTDETASQIAKLVSQPTVNRGAINFTNSVGGGGNSATAGFSHFTSAQYAAKEPGGLVSLGGCTVYNFSFRGGADVSANPIRGTALDAGPSITMTPPSGPGVSLPFDRGGYTAVGFMLGPGSFQGTYTFSGSGGMDIGPFKAEVTFPGGASGFRPSTPNNSISVDRSQSLLVTWPQPGNTDPSQFIQITGSSAIFPGRRLGAAFYCNVPLKAGQFTVSSTVLLALPPQPSDVPPNLGNSSLEVDLVTHRAFSAPGLDQGFINFTLGSVVAFGYQ